MKRLYSLIALALFCAVCTSARWIVGDRKNASQLKAGDTVVIEVANRATDLGTYINVSSTYGVEIKTGIGADDDAIIVLEQGPNDIRTGASTVYLKMLSTGMYIGQNTSWETGCGVASDKTNAANFQVISCGEDIPWSNTYSWENYQSGVFRDDATDTSKEYANWRVNGAGRGSDDNSVGFCWSQDEGVFKYLAYWNAKAPRVILWNYTDTNQWNVYGISYEKNLTADLQDLIDRYTEDNNYIAGTDPGFYDKAAVDTYNNAMQQSKKLLEGEATDAQLTEAIANLKAANAAASTAFIPITEGYYYFINGFGYFLTNFGIEKAAYSNTGTMSMCYKTFDPNDANFIFKVTKTDEEDEFWVQSYTSGYYVGGQTFWYGSRTSITSGKEEPQNLCLRYSGLWFWGSHTYHQSSINISAGSASTARDSEGELFTWGTWDNDKNTTEAHSNLWYLRKITDQEIKKTEKISLNKSDITLALRSTDSLTATVMPTNAWQGVSWSSSNDDICSVNKNGLIVARQIGEAYIFATTTDGTSLKDSCKVNVTRYYGSLSAEATLTTQTSATIKATCEVEGATVTSETIDGQAVNNGFVRLVGLTPGTTYTKTYTVETSDGESESIDFTFTTKDVVVNLDGTVGSTSVALTGSYEAGDATIVSQGFVDGVSGNHTTVGGLDPATMYTFTFYVTTEEGGKTFSKSATFTTQQLELAMQNPKVVSTGNVIIAAESNIADEDEENIGFQWRRIDWTDEFASRTGPAYLYDCKMEGYINDLNSAQLWRARSFYKSGSNTYYYSDWIGIDPSDVSFFEPSVHTYASVSVSGNSANVRGYAITGSDDVVEQGFKYWKKAGKSGSPLFPQATDVPDDAMTVFVSGQSMMATLENLQENTQYSYVAFVKTTRGDTYYGEEQTIEIDDPVGIGGITEETPTIDDNISVRVYTLSGNLVYAGAEADMSLDKGIYIIRYPDGKTKKVAY